MIALLSVAFAADPTDVVEVVGHDVQVNWTTLMLEARAGAPGSGNTTFEAVEQLARREVLVAVQQAVGSVRVTSEARVADLLSDQTLGEQIQSRVGRWEVDEATYGASGRVELRATLSLQDLLKPWALQIARSGSAPPPPPGVSGILVDARGTGLTPAYAIRLVDSAGNALYAGELFEEQAVLVAPFWFVTDPAHVAAGRAGDRPLVVRGTHAEGQDLVLDASSAKQIADVGEALLLRGGVVVVVDAR